MFRIREDSPEEMFELVTETVHCSWDRQKIKQLERYYLPSIANHYRWIFVTVYHPRQGAE